MDDEEQSLLNDREPDALPDAAAEAFAALSQRVAGMEERLDGRMAMMTRALEHIAIEKQSVEIPDYYPDPCQDRRASGDACAADEKACRRARHTVDPGEHGRADR
ncbi:hypothetical protein [Sphingobium fuliginis]|uniref:hypothetical protein n=1 Tax=Sphingobium fuliginis (strain ATCC 27551) TaxID=336203 RepID=UPI001FCB0F39|nr:hypothetical protein [Sphingobium fuliginis]